MDLARDHTFRRRAALARSRLGDALLRRYSTAFSMSPAVSSSAFCNSIIPAPWRAAELLNILRVNVTVVVIRYVSFTSTPAASHTGGAVVYFHARVTYPARAQRSLFGGVSRLPVPRSRAASPPVLRRPRSPRASRRRATRTRRRRYVCKSSAGSTTGGSELYVVCSLRLHPTAPVGENTPAWCFWRSNRRWPS